MREGGADQVLEKDDSTRAWEFNACGRPRGGRGGEFLVEMRDRKVNGSSQRKGNQDSNSAKNHSCELN